MCIPTLRENVTVVSTTEIICPQPPMAEPWPSPTYLEVSVDGQVFSKSFVQYYILGIPVGLDVEEKLAVINAADAVAFNTTIVFTVDQYGHRLMDFDDNTPHVTASLRRHHSTENNCTATTTTVLSSSTIELSDGQGRTVLNMVTHPNPCLCP